VRGPIGVLPPLLRLRNWNVADGRYLGHYVGICLVPLGIGNAVQRLERHRETRSKTERSNSLTLGFACSPEKIWSNGFGMPDSLTTLYRPVGRKELDLIRASGFRAFPPRLSSQPFFYPVLNEEYAVQIARDWNTKDEASGYEGYVLKFDVRMEFLNQYEVHVVGNSKHREYWIPAGDLQELNYNIAGVIEIVEEFR